MNKRWLIILLGILGIVMVYEILSNPFSTLMLIIGSLVLLFRNRVEEENQNTVLVLGIGALTRQTNKRVRALTQLLEPV